MSELPFVLFRLANERYGVPVEQVRSIEWTPPVTRVPHTLPFITGVTSLRGAILPVVDLRERFGFPVSHEGESQMMVVEVGEVTVGLLVDEVMDVIRIDEERIEPPPALAGGIEAAYLRGVVHLDDSVLVLLNLDRVLTDAEERQLREAQRRVSGTP
jgi:purine-binding chemotaxis protein CheW